MKVTILHTNDVHAEYESWLKCAWLIKRRRAEIGPENCLVVDVGDHLDLGVNECRLSGGHLNLELLNELGLDAFTPGNNEFYRLPRHTLTQLTMESQFPWVLSTVAQPDGTDFAAVRRHLILERGGMTIGIVGALDPMENAAGRLHGLKSLDLTEALTQKVRELKSCGAQLILLLSHCGLRDDLKFAAENPGLIDVIVGGHSHSELHEIRRVGDTIIVQAGMLGKFVGELEIELEFDHDHDNRQSDEHCNEYSDMQKQRIVNVNRYCLHDTSNLDDIDGAATATPAAAATATIASINQNQNDQAQAARAILEKHRATVKGILDEKLCTLEEDFSHDTMIQLLAELMRHKFGAEIGMMFGPGVSGGLRKGSLHVRDIYEICKSFITPAAFEISGRQIEGLIRERNNPAITQAQGFGIGFRPQGQVFGRLAFAGLTCSGENSDRPVILINGTELDPERWYTVGSATHLFNSETGGYPSMNGSRNIRFERFHYIRDELVDFFRSDPNRIAAFIKVANENCNGKL